MRITVAVTAAFAAGLLACSGAFAQATKPARMLVGFPPGGGYDLAAPADYRLDPSREMPMARSLRA